MLSSFNYFVAIITWFIFIPASKSFNNLHHSTSSSKCLSSTTTKFSTSLQEKSSNNHITKQKFDYEFHIAPMQCYTNLPLRKLFSLLSPSSILWTEMEKVNDIMQYECASAWSKRLGLPSEDYSNLVLQLGCSDPLSLKKCISQTLSTYNTLKGINLNCGCPSIQSGGSSDYGASLMKDCKLTGDLVYAMKEAIAEQSMFLPSSMLPEISVKCRVGVIDTFDEIRPFDEQRDYNFLYNYVSTMRDSGVDHVILHARPAILSGLSPAKNRSVPQLNYAMVEKVASDFKDLRITLNGGIASLDHLESMIGKAGDTHVSSHMAGRWCLSRPLDLVGIESILSQTKQEHNHIISAIEKYTDFCEKIILSSRNTDVSTADLCLPLYLISEQLKEEYEFCISKHEDEDVTNDSFKGTLKLNEIEEIYDVLGTGISRILSFMNDKSDELNITTTDYVNFKKLSKSFKSVVGSKVVNKWRRNRAELLCQ